MTLQYEDRIVAYADVIGWKAACEDPERYFELLEATQAIAQYARNFSPEVKGKVEVVGCAHGLHRGARQLRTFSRKSYNNAIGAIKSALTFGARDLPGQVNPAAFLKYAKTPKVHIDPFSLREAEELIAALHAKWCAGMAHFHELRFFTGLRPCEALALRVNDYEREQACWRSPRRAYADASVSRPRTAATGASSCARGRSTCSSGSWRGAPRWRRAGLIEHDNLFCHASGAPLRRSSEPGSCWMKTLVRLPVRYRRPYVARHTSVSWRLMVGEPPLWVAEQQGHSVITMFTVYAAWVRAARPEDVAALRAALDAPRRPASFGTGLGH